MLEFCPHCQMSIVPSDAGESCLHCGMHLAEAADHKAAGGFDPAFRQAVDEGFLTPGQAYARGKREACAGRLAARHGVPLTVAYEIADNRVSLTEALRERHARTSNLRLEPAPRAPGLPGWLVVAAGVLAIATFAVPVLIDATVTTEQVTAGSRPPVDGVMTDRDGRVLRVVGADPARVLAGYCRTGDSGSLEALGLMETSAPSAVVRVGVLRDRDRPGEDLAIAIRHDRYSGSWYAGDGVHALAPSPAPPSAATRLVQEN